MASETETRTESPELAEMWARLHAVWGDELFRPETEPEPEPIPDRPPHTCPSMAGETAFGPDYWRTARAIPWHWIIEADRLGNSARHVRAGVLVRVMYDVFRCGVTKPVRLGVQDSGYLGIRENDFTGILRDLDRAGLIRAEFHQGRKIRAVPINPKSRIETGRWKTPRNLWWPALSHISIHLPAVSFVAYLFLTMHTARKSNVAIVPPILPGWVRNRRDYQRGISALVGSGLIVRSGLREYTLPVLFGPNPTVTISPGRATLPEPEYLEP